MDSMLDALDQRMAAERRLVGFFARLSDEQREELLEVRRRFQAGHYIGRSASAMARALKAECDLRGIAVCGVQGLRVWLSQQET